MLSTLRIKNLALVEHCTLEFQPGLNVITGETGAGKSILVGALGLLLGERADKTLIRAGAEACGAEAVFHLPDASEVDALLESCGLEACEEGQLVIRRVVRAGAGGQVLVNDSPVTLQVLKRIGQILVDLHGPHDHQSLLQPDAQLDILDAFGHLWDERATYERSFEAVRELQKQRGALALEDDHAGELLDLLHYRVEEISEAALEEGEEETLLKEHRVIGHAQRILELAGQVVGALTEGEGSAFETMAGTRVALDELGRLLPAAASWNTEAEDLTRRLQELSAAISREAGEIEAEPVRMEWLDQRLALYAKMKKKYGPEVADVLQTLEDSRARLVQLETRGERLAALDKELDEAGKSLNESGRALRKKRKAVSTRLGRAVTRELRALGFPHGSFSVKLADAEPAPSGMDQVDFGFAPNEGEPSRPLRNIASSGEISRVMLATKAVLAAHDRIPVLVFDEIDANLGGEMGHAVGGKLAEVAVGHQVICITHLPQVAVFGTSHFAVTKTARRGRTVTEVERLHDEELRAREVARMLGGVEHTPVTLQHARELLEKV